MSWIKRNLYFLIGGLIALGLMGGAGWYLYSKWELNNQTFDKLTEQYEALKKLNSQPLQAGSGSVDNITLAKQQQQQVRDFLKKTQPHFQRIPPIPDVPKLSDREFSTTLSRTIDQMQHDATNLSVAVPKNYGFSFDAQRSRMSFPAGSLPLLATQVGEVKAICDVLFQAKVNSLDNIRRERISADDNTGNQTDYLNEKSVTNELAVVTPYELTMRCFSQELADVLAGFASSPHGLIVKKVNTEPAGTPTTTG